MSYTQESGKFINVLYTIPWKTFAARELLRLRMYVYWIQIFILYHDVLTLYKNVILFDVTFPILMRLHKVKCMFWAQL